MLSPKSIRWPWRPNDPGLGCTTSAHLPDMWPVSGNLKPRTGLEPTVRRGSSELFRTVQTAFIEKWLSTALSQTGTRVGSVKYESTDQYTSPTFFVVYTLWLFWFDPSSMKTKTSSSYDTNYFTCTLNKGASSMMQMHYPYRSTGPGDRDQRETGLWFLDFSSVSLVY